jgi:hypothetical protein
LSTRFMTLHCLLVRNILVKLRHAQRLGAHVY